MKYPVKSISPPPTVFILLLFTLLSLCSCSKKPPYYYRITALNLYNVDNSGTVPVDAATTNLAAASYAIRLQYDALLTSSKGAERYESGYASSNPVTSLFVCSLSDYDATHAAGSSLNDYFLHGSGTIVRTSDSIQLKLAKAQVGLSYHSDDTENTWHSSEYLVLMQPPTIMGTRSFVVNMGFADNIHLADTISVTLH